MGGTHTPSPGRVSLSLVAAQQQSQRQQDQHHNQHKQQPVPERGHIVTSDPMPAGRPSLPVSPVGFRPAAARLPLSPSAAVGLSRPSAAASDGRPVSAGQSDYSLNLNHNSSYHISTYHIHHQAQPNPIQLRPLPLGTPSSVPAFRKSSSGSPPPLLSNEKLPPISTLLSPFVDTRATARPTQSQSDLRPPSSHGNHSASPSLTPALPSLLPPEPGPLRRPLAPPHLQYTSTSSVLPSLAPLPPASVHRYGDPSNTTLVQADHLSKSTTFPQVEVQTKVSVSVSNHRPFRCDICMQCFSRNHDLKRHKRIHMAVKPFQCSKCGKNFSRKDALRVSSFPHLFSRDLRVLPIKCLGVLMNE